MKVTRSQEYPGLGAAIVEAVQRSPKTKSALAKETGMSRTYLYKLLEGQPLTITLECVRRIEKALDIDLGVE